MGIFFAAIAILSWGLGDFFIQRSARKLGNLVALFSMTAIGTLALLPFVLKDFLAICHEQPQEIYLLLGASVVILISSLLQFQALRIGKISVVEPIYALEIPVTAVLAFIVLHERLSLAQSAFIGLIVLGIILISVNSWTNLRKTRLEAGVWYALIAVIAMGTVNFIVGLSARATNPFVIVWFSCAFIALSLLAYLAGTGKLSNIKRSWEYSAGLLLSLGVTDNLAWLAYGVSALYLPIAVATGLSESYIAVSALLGLYVNKEKLRTHQAVGLVIVVIAVVMLARLAEK